MTERTTGAHYSLFRFLLGAYLVVHFVMLLPYGAEVFSHAGALAEGAASPLFGILPNPLQWNDGPAMVALLLTLGVACGTAIAMGWGDRVAALLATAVLGWLFQRNPLIANPSLPLVGWMLVMHAFVPPRPLGSISGALHGVASGWRLPQHLHLAAWVILALCYSHSGWTKLASPSWIDGDTIRLVLQNPLARDHALREWLLATPPLLLQLLTWALLTIELLFAPLAIIRRARPWLWLAMLAAQIGFLLLLDFADLTFPMLLAHLLTFDPHWLSRRERTSPAVVLFDGDCAFCHASVRLALHESTDPRLAFAPLAGRTARMLTRGEPLPHGGQSIVLIDAEGRQEYKSRAVAGILERLGGLWLIPAALLRRLPRALADRAYDLVGGWRHRLGGSRDRDAACVVMPGVRAVRILP
jgi:predicted DCC family thiol-disulfide oxidoreductase YuxK